MLSCTTIFKNKEHITHNKLFYVFYLTFSTFIQIVTILRNVIDYTTENVCLFMGEFTFDLITKWSLTC